MSLVLDGSATLAWIYPDETTEAIEALFDDVVRTGAMVPCLWRLEVANSLTTALRRGRITPNDRDASLRDLADLLIETDREGEMHFWNDGLKLADRHMLTIYDAAYLELALRLSIPLATLDRDLRNAAKKEKVRLLGM